MVCFSWGEIELNVRRTQSLVRRIKVICVAPSTRAMQIAFVHRTKLRIRRTLRFSIRGLQPNVRRTEACIRRTLGFEKNNVAQQRPFFLEP